MLRILLPFLFVSAVLCTYGGGGGSYAEYDCGGSCGGGCSQQSGSYSSPCGGGQAPAPVIQYESSGCEGDCGSGGSSSRYSSGRASSSGYHKSVTTVTKETRNDHLKIIVGKPVVHRTTYVQPAPQPQVVYKQRYVDEGSNYGGGGSSYSGGGGDYDCGGQCGGGSKIVKIIKKTTTYGGGGGGGGVCTTCDYSGGGGDQSSYSSNIEYSQPIVHKVTRIVTQPKIVRVIKTSVVSPVETSGEYYESPSSSCGGGGCGQSGGYTSKRYTSGGSGGHGGGGGRSKAFAFASASASAGAGAGAGSGDYTSGGGGGCKSGCEEWKK